MTEWRCSRCLHGHDVPVVSEERAVRSESVESPRQCGVCRVRLRRGQSGVECADCGLVAHNKCCGMSRWARERGSVWRCGRCRLSGASGVRVEPEPESGGAGEERESACWEVCCV